jgi:ssDNA-binding Zn-finger/Zn-ribbon topoisomerase 1
MATSINSKDITCPECGGLCKIKINNYKIKLYECKNDHIKDNIA